MEWKDIKSVGDINTWMVEHLADPSKSALFEEAFYSLSVGIMQELDQLQSTNISFIPGMGTIGRHAAQTMTIGFPDDPSRDHVMIFAVTDEGKVLSLDLLPASQVQEINLTRPN